MSIKAGGARAAEAEANISLSLRFARQILFHIDSRSLVCQKNPRGRTSTWTKAFQVMPPRVAYASTKPHMIILIDVLYIMLKSALQKLSKSFLRRDGVTDVMA